MREWEERIAIVTIFFSSTSRVNQNITEQSDLYEIRITSIYNDIAKPKFTQ